MMKTHNHIQLVNDILNVMFANGMIQFMTEYGTPLISFCTACGSAFYIFYKIKKEFFNNGK